MSTRERITTAVAGAMTCAFIDDLGRPRLAYPTPVSARGARACVRPRPRPRRTKLTLEFDPGAEPITGSLRDDRGARRTFAGWLGLFAALDTVLSARRTSHAEQG